MKKFLLLIALVAGSLTAQAQFNDSLPFFKLDRVLLKIEGPLGSFSGLQRNAMQSSITPLLRRAKGKELTPQQRTRLKMEVRKAIFTELTPEQQTRLKATRRDGRDALDQALAGPRKKQKRRQ